MLVICVAIFIGYIWPEIINFGVANNEKKNNMQVLNDAKKRTADINAVIKQLSTDLNDKKIVDSYLPNVNMEERVIGGINYLANSAGVPLLNITTAKASGASIKISPVATTGSNANGSTLNDEKNNEMQLPEFTILISGEYDKLNLFIDKLQKMALFNSIKSLTIKNSAAEKEPADTASANKIAATSTSKNLSAEIVVKFGYLKTNNFSENQLVRLDPKLDSGTINTLKLYLDQKDVSVISETGEAGLVGKKNPFFLE